MSESKESSKFTDSEMQFLAHIMRSLKTGAIEIDYIKLAGYANMSNPRSAANKWASMKKKLFPPDGDPATSDGPTPATTPKKGGRGAKAKTANGEEGNEAESPTKTPRKRKTAKKDEDGSPKKRGRPAKKDIVRAEGDDEEASAASIKAEDGSAETSMFGDGAVTDEETAV